jgi:hypothetical protein
MRPLLVSALLAAVSAAPAAAQTIHGRVLERGTDRPVPDAAVELRSGKDVRAAARTDADGTFALDAPGAGTYRLAASRVGFMTLSSEDLRIERLDSVFLTFRLDANAVPLEPVEVSVTPWQPPARLAGFYDRSRHNRQGHFLTREMIEAANASRTTDLLRRIPGLLFRPTAKGYAVRGRGGCEPQVYVDGMDVNLFGNSNTVDELVRPEDLEGIEVYGESAIPVEYERNTKGDECGAIMLWTRLSL